MRFVATLVPRGVRSSSVSQKTHNHQFSYGLNNKNNNSKPQTVPAGVYLCVWMLTYLDKPCVMPCVALPCRKPGWAWRQACAVKGPPVGPSSLCSRASLQSPEFLLPWWLPPAMFWGRLGFPAVGRGQAPSCPSQTLGRQPRWLRDRSPELVGPRASIRGWPPFGILGPSVSDHSQGGFGLVLSARRAPRNPRVETPGSEVAVLGGGRS